MPDRVDSKFKRPDLKKIFLNKTFLLFSILAIVLIILFNFIYIPLGKKLRDLNIQYRQVSLKLSEMKATIASADKIKAKVIGRPENIPHSLDELTKKANILGIDFDSMRQEGLITLSKDYQILPLYIETVCDFQALANFLGALEDLEMGVIVVKQLEIIREEDLLPDLRASIELGMYLKSE